MTINHGGSSKSDSFKTLARSCSSSMRVERSQFIAHCGVSHTAKDARAFIAAIQQEYKNATHNCWAYRAGYPGPETEFCSDAGEPSGSAGRPILSVIQSNDLHNCVIVVTRYFGGRKLGIPGLIRAYSQAAQRVIDEAGTAECYAMKRARAVCDYASLSNVEYIINSMDAVIEDRVFTDRVELALCARASQCDRLVSSLKSLCTVVTLEDDQLHLTTGRSEDTAAP